MADTDHPHETELALLLRNQGIAVADIARQLGVSICVVQRWFDLVDELSTTADDGFRGMPDSYNNVRP